MGGQNSLVVSIRFLQIILFSTILYVALPSTLFLIALPVSNAVKVLSVVLIFALLVKAFHNVRGLYSDRDQFKIRPHILLLVIGILVFSHAPLLSGKNFLYDWGKHRSMLLSVYSKPVAPELCFLENATDVDLQKRALVFYFAQYMPAAYIVKAIYAVFHVENQGIEGVAKILALTFFLWNTFGLILAFLLMPAACNKMFKLRNRHTWGWAYIVILIFSGLGYWVKAITTGSIYVGHAEWAIPYFANIPSFLSHWQWAPHHLLPAMLSVILLFLYSDNLKKLPLGILMLFLISGSVFSWMGIIPIITYLFFRSYFLGAYRSLIPRLKVLLSDTYLEISPAFLFTVNVLLFYASKSSPEVFDINRSLSARYGFLKYFLFILSKTLPMIIIGFIVIIRKMHVPVLVLISLFLLVFIPLFQLGLYNDLSMRMTLPALLIIMMFAGSVIQENMSNQRAFIKLCIGIFFVLTIPAFLNEYYMGLKADALFWLAGEKQIRQYMGTGEIWLIGK